MVRRRGRGSPKRILNFVAWLAGIVVSLSVGFTMAFGTLAFPRELGGVAVSVIVGWVIIILTVVLVASTLLK